MRHHVQVALVIATLLYLCGGLFMLLAPESAHQVFSTGPYDPVTLTLLTAAVLAFATIFFIAAPDPSRGMVHMAAMGLLFIGLTMAHLMFIAGTLPLGPVTGVGLVINLIVAVYLLIALSAMRLQPATAPARAGRRARTARRGRR